MKSGIRSWHTPGTFVLSILLGVLALPEQSTAAVVDGSVAQGKTASGKAVVPQGWRLTKHGWEHTSTWTLGSSDINQLIAAQRDREPAWIRFGFSILRSIPPLMVALLQITAIAVITNIARNYQQRNLNADAAEGRSSY